MIISDAAFVYLIHQAGDLNALSGQRQIWEAAYRDKLKHQFESIQPFLPARCRSVIDVGSGLGGIDVYLSHYFGVGCQIHLLDGDNGRMQASSHDVPHNSMGVALAFQKANGVDGVSALPLASIVSVSADLVISFAAWCFHIPPDEHLAFVASCCHPGTVIILDVRRGKPEWEEQLERRFDFVAVIAEERKFRRMVFAGR